MGDPRHELGQRAEALTASWLETAGWQVLARRWRVPQGELDLVCREPDGTLVAVEVRLRRSNRAGSAAESIDAHRLRRLRGALASFARQQPGRVSGDLRVDLVTVSPESPGRWRLVRHPSVDAW